MTALPPQHKLICGPYRKSPTRDMHGYAHDRYLRTNCAREPPYSWSDISERSKDDAINIIVASAGIDTLQYWLLAAETTECPNWIAWWFLYHHFRHRDGRKKKKQRFLKMAEALCQTCSPSVTVTLRIALGTVLLSTIQWNTLFQVGLLLPKHGSGELSGSLEKSKNSLPETGF